MADCGLLSADIHWLLSLWCDGVDHNGGMKMMIRMLIPYSDDLSDPPCPDCHNFCKDTFTVWHLLSNGTHTNFQTGGRLGKGKTEFHSRDWWHRDRTNQGRKHVLRHFSCDATIFINTGNLILRRLYFEGKAHKMLQFTLLYSNTGEWRRLVVFKKS